MHLQIDTNGERVEVLDVDDLKQFRVQVSGPSDRESVAHALGGLGALDSTNHAWIDVEALLMASGRADDESWVTRFEDMIGFAAAQGWVNDAGTAVRAHLESEDLGV